MPVTSVTDSSGSTSARWTISVAVSASLSSAARVTTCRSATVSGRRRTVAGIARLGVGARPQHPGRDRDLERERAAGQQLLGRQPHGSSATSIDSARKRIASRTIVSASRS